MEEAYDMSCISKFVHETEIEKFITVAQTIDFTEHYKGKKKRKKIICLNMDGCCRHYDPTHEIFAGYRVIATDSSKAMLEYG